ncbi:hypothetical protein JTB14_030110 [Gonioctena quinquepunctata]|nr:hypothetical protein JTB14_030110 [Gonioctena quinquepunctata]
MNIPDTVSTVYQRIMRSDLKDAHDLTAQQREELAVLERHLNANRQYHDRTSFIRKNKLIIDGREYSVEQLLEAEKEETGEQLERRSLPSTATQPLIKEAFDDGITKLNQETTNIPITPKPSGSSGAIKKQPPKPFNQNIEKVKPDQIMREESNLFPKVSRNHH